MLTDLEATERVLKKARCPEDVFGRLAGSDAGAMHVSLRQSYHRVVGVVHPDKYAGQPDAVARAQLLIGKLAEWRKTAEAKIEAGTYGDNKPHEVEPPKPAPSPQIIRTPKRQYIVTDLVAQGDLADLYRCAYTEGGRETHAIFKIAQSAADNDFLDNEHRVLAAMYPQAQEPEKFYRFLPKPLDSFLLRGDRSANRRVNVLQLVDEYVSLAEVMRAYPSGIDYRDAAWMFNRGLETLWFVHSQKNVVHGAVLPTHLLVHPVRHGAKLVDWCYAVGDWKNAQDHVKALSKAYRAYYPPEVLQKKAATPQTDIYMLAKCAVALLGGDVATGKVPDTVPKLVRAFLSGCLIELPSKRPDDAGQLREEFEELLTRLVGERQHRPLVMPAKM